MRMIGTLPGEAEAERFTAYLLTLRIDAHAEKADTSNNWLIWVEHDDLIDRGREELTQFSAFPGDPKYAAVDAARQIRRQQEKAALRRRKNFTDVRTSWANVQRHDRPVTLLLVAVSVLVFLLTRSHGATAQRTFDALVFEPPMAIDAAQAGGEDDDANDARQLQSVLAEGVRSPWLAATDAVRHGQIWRLWTSVFLHGGIAHIAFNMMWLYSMGGRLEARKGPWVMVGLFLIGGLVSNLGQVAWMVGTSQHHYGPLAGAVFDVYGVQMIGMSGVDYAIFGFLWLYGRKRPSEGLMLTPQDIGLAVAWLVICMTGLIGNIANAAHVMGLVAGLAMAWGMSQWGRGLRR